MRRKKRFITTLPWIPDNIPDHVGDKFRECPPFYHSCLFADRQAMF